MLAAMHDLDSITLAIISSDTFVPGVLLIERQPVATIVDWDFAADVQASVSGGSHKACRRPDSGFIIWEKPSREIPSGTVATLLLRNRQGLIRRLNAELKHIRREGSDLWNAVAVCTSKTVVFPRPHHMARPSR